MQSSGYGGVSEIQKFLAENGGTQPFMASAWMPGFISDPKCYSSSHSNQQMSLPTHFAQFQSLPFTQQLFQPSPLHQFQLFDSHPHRQQQLSDIALGAGIGVSADSSVFIQPASMNFKLAMDANIMNVDGNDVGGPESDLHIHRQKWQREDEGSISDVPWSLDIDYINSSNKRCKDYTTQDQLFNSIAKLYANETEIRSIGGENNFKVFSELEAIYKPSNNSSSNSGSGLTTNELSLIPAVPITPIAEASTEGKLNVRRRKKRKRQQIANSVVAFFEGLVNQLVNNQETLERKFKEIIDKKDQERASREAAWQEERAANSSRQASSLSEHQALVASREATIISFVEKIARNDASQPTDISWPHQDNVSNETFSDSPEHNKKSNKLMFLMQNSRWPREEVEALIKIRSEMESKFQEPGMKGPLWDEVSAAMKEIGYCRSNKRCKEKWENINKYFRRTIESGKKRRQSSKTCPYFQHLEELYLKSMLSSADIYVVPSAGNADDNQHKDSDQPSNATSVSELEFNGEGNLKNHCTDKDINGDGYDEKEKDIEYNGYDENRSHDGDEEEGKGNA